MKTWNPWISLSLQGSLLSDLLMNSQDLAFPFCLAMVHSSAAGQENPKEFENICSLLNQRFTPQQSPEDNKHNCLTIDDSAKDGGPHFTQCMIGICPLVTHSYQNLQLRHKILTAAAIDLGRRNFVKSTLS